MNGSHVDVIGIAEHWLLEPEIQYYGLDGYKLASWRCRENDPHGGVLIYVREHIPVKNYPKLDNLSQERDFEVCAITLDQQNTLIINLYRTPDGNLATYFNKLDTLLTNVSRKFKNIVIMGDFNINFNKKDSKDTIWLLDITSSYGLRYVTNEPTRNENCIDNIFINENMIVENVDISRPALSDHDAIEMKLNLSIKPKKAKKTYRNFSFRNKTAFMNDLAQLTWISVYNEVDPQRSCEYIIHTLQYLVAKNFPYTTRTIETKTLKFGENLKTARDMLLTLQAIHQRHQTEQTQNQLKQFKKVYSNLLQTAKKQDNIHKLRTADNISKKTWQVINRECLRKKEKEVPQIEPNALNRHFANIATTITQQLPSSKQNYQNFLKETPSIPNSLLISPTSTEEVISIIANLRSTPSKDIYGLDTKILKMAVSHISQPIAHVINLCIENTVFPDSLKVALITPIYKKGNRNDPNNYRPIALLPILSKVFEKVLQKRLLAFLQKYNLISDYQFGFLPEKSTSLATVQVIEYICESFEQNMITTAAFLDLSKAFDCVDHKTLLSKLEHKGIRGKSLDLFCSYLQNRKQALAQTNLLPVKSGVPQGSILGPLLFIIFIDDFPAVVNTHKCLYADDTSLFVREKTIAEAEHIITVALNHAKQWFTANHLQLNEDKTSRFSFSHHHQLNNANPSVRFLGFTIDEQLNWNHHINKLSGKISQNIYAIRKLTQIADQRTARVAYFAMIHSHLSYGTILWGASVNVKRIFILQKKVVRILAGKKIGTHCKPLFVQLQILTIHAVYIIQTVTYIRKQQTVTHKDLHSHNTRAKNNLIVPFHRIYKSRTGPNYWAFKIYNKIPTHLRQTLSTCSLLYRLKHFLLSLAPYSLSEFLEADTSSL